MYNLSKKFLYSVVCGGVLFGATTVASMAEVLYAKCVDKNQGVSVQVDMGKGMGTLYLMGNNTFSVNAKYLPIRGSSDSKNIIEMKGDGARAFHLNKSRNIIYFREGSTGTFCKVDIQKRG